MFCRFCIQFRYKQNFKIIMKNKAEETEQKDSLPKISFSIQTRDLSDTISETYVKSLIGLPDYIYERNYSKESKLQKIGHESFQNRNLYSITFPPSLTTILPKAMDKLRYLFQITFLKSDINENFLEDIGDSALRNTDIDLIDIPENIRKIGKYCFPKTLKQINFENGAPHLTYIGNNAFNNTQLETIQIPLNITPFCQAKNIFSQCKLLKKIIFDSYINKNDPPAIDYEDNKEIEKRVLLKRLEYEDRLNIAQDTDINIKITDLEAEIGDPYFDSKAPLDFAQYMMLSQTNLTNLEVFISNLNKFYFYNTPNLITITIPAKKDGRYIKQKGCLYTKDKRKLIVAERNIKNVTILANCQVITNYALNIQTLEKVSFEKNSELQEISSFAFAESNIKKLIIPDSVNFISHGAFYGCVNLESINVPTSLNVLDIATFSYSKLKEIKIPKSVTIIDSYCFYKCSQLKRVEFEEDSGLILIGIYAFANTKNESISIPKTVEKIGDFCFINCRKLKKVQFDSDSNLTEIGKECFRGTKIESIELPQKIEEFDFLNTKIKNVTFSIDSTFQDLTNFGSSLITSIVIPSSVTIICLNAFIDCFNLSEVKVNDISNSKLEFISPGSFYNCKSLTTFEVPKTVKYFGQNCFRNCAKYNGQIEVNNDTNITVQMSAFENSGVTVFNSKSRNIKICQNAFRNCKGLSQFSAEAEIECILEKSSFFNCSSLTGVKLHYDTNRVELGESCFMNTAITEIEIPSNLQIIPKFCFKNCKNLKKVTINEDSQITLISKESFLKSGVETILIPSKTETIETVSFKDCSQLKTVTFSMKLKECTLEEKAFYNSGIESLNILKGIKKINDSCFQKCSNLKKVTFSKDLSFDSIGDQVFHSTGIESIIIPSCISNISESAFRNCQNLQTVTFQGKNTFVSQYAFTGCTKLQKVKCKSPITLETAQDTEIFSSPKVYLTLNQDQINKIIIQTFFTNLKPYFQDFIRFDFQRTLAFNMKWRFNELFDCSSCIHFEEPIAEHLKYHILEIQDGGYYKNCMKKLCFCDFSTNELKVAKETEVIKSNAFKNSRLKRIEFEEGCQLKTIKNFVFEYLQIEEITIPDTVTSIGNSAFSNCYSLRKVTIKPTSQLTTIGSHAFEKTAIETILFPETLTTVSDFAFYETFYLLEIENYSKKVNFGEFSFYRSSIANINFPDTCVFSYSSFKECLNLRELSFVGKDQDVLIDEESFAFSGLEELKIKCKATINANAFMSCMYLKKITLNGPNIEFHKSSFINTNVEVCVINLNYQIYPDIKDIIATSIEKCSIKCNCDKEDTEYSFLVNHKCISTNNTLIYADMIDNFSLTKEGGNNDKTKKNEILQIPSSVKKLDFPIMTHIKKIIFPSNCSLEDLGAPGFFSYYSLTEITIPKLVKVIPDGLFENCHFLKVLQFEEGSLLEEIGSYSFSKTKIVKAYLPNSVQVIHKGAFSDNPCLTEVTFEGETIEDEAFESTGLTSFTLSNNTVTIGSNAFAYCHSLTTFNVDIDNSKLASIGSEAFLDTSITMINIPPQIKAIEPLVFASCQSLKEVNISLNSSIEKVDTTSFSTTPSLTKLTMSRTILNLFEYILDPDPSFLSVLDSSSQNFVVIDDKKDQKVSLILNFSEENTINSYTNNCYVINHELVYANLIDNHLLYEKPTDENNENIENKDNLKSNEILKVPINVKKLNFPPMTHVRRVLWSTDGIVEDFGSPGLFQYYNLTQFTIPKSVKVIPPYSFKDCHFLSILMFEDESALEEIGEYSFANTRIKKVRFPDSVKVIHKLAFFNNLNLKEVIFKGETIEDEAFAQTGITLFRLSNNVKTIGSGAFRDCHSLLSFTIDIDNSKLSEIGSYAFSETSIKLFNIPQNVKVIQPFTFSGCKKLRNVNISAKSKLEIIDKYSFAGNLSLLYINIPKTIKKLSYKAFINTPSLQSIMDESNDDFCVFEDNSIYAKDKSLVFVPRNLKQYKLIPNCLVIHSGSFCGPNLEKVSFSDNSLICIEKCGFAHSTGLKSITIPSSVQYIGSECFIDCRNLDIVDFEPGSKFKNIPKYCFAYSGLKTICLPASIEVINHSSFSFCNNLKTVNLEATNTKFIGEFAFSETSINDMKLPPSIEFIGNCAFRGNESFKSIDLTNIKKFEKSVDIRQIYRKSRKDLIKSKKETLKLINNYSEQPTIEFDTMQINANYNINNNENKSPRRYYGTNSKIPVQKASYAMLKKLPGIIKPDPNNNAKVSKISSPTKLAKLPPIAPPQNQSNDPSPRRNKQSTKATNNEEQKTNDIEIKQSEKCFIHENAFIQSCVKTFKFNLENVEWLDFLENCSQIERFYPNTNILIRLEKTGKENKHSKLLDGSMFTITKYKCRNQTSIPCLNYQSLNELTIPNQITSFRPYNFTFCEKLTAVTFDEGIDIKSIPKYCFAYCFSLKEISIPIRVELIDKFAFYSCSSLEKVNFSKNNKLKAIQDGAFSKCERLTSFHISKSVKEIGNSAFMECISLSKVSFSDNCVLNSIKENCFSKCIKLSTITLPKNVVDIPGNCFSFSGMKSIKMPANLKTIGKRAFYSCGNLNAVIFNDKITEIGEFAFAKDASLVSIDLPNSLSKIKSCAFMDCYNLQKVNTTEKTKLVVIQDGSFENTQIEELRISSNATEIFSPRNIPKLNKIKFTQNSPKHFIKMKDGSIYKKNNDAKLDENEIVNIDEIEKSFVESLTSKNNEQKYNYSKMANKILFQRNRSKYSPDKISKHPVLSLVFYPKNSEIIEIHQDCFSIGDSVLDGMNNLSVIEYKKGVTNSVMNFPNYNHLYTGIQNNLTEIKINGEFCNLEPKVFSYFRSLEIFEVSDQTKLALIPKEAFIGCSNLCEVYIPSTCYSIEEGAFKDCVRLRVFEIVKVKTKGNKTKPSNSLKLINKEAFYNCSSLESFSIPSSVAKIGKCAFMNCLSLKDVHFEQSKEESLEAIQQGAFKNCKSLESFSLPSSVVHLGPSAFMNCFKLKTFEYNGSQLEDIQCRTFANCASLERIEIHGLKFTIEEQPDQSKQVKDKKKQAENKEEKKEQTENDQEKKEQAENDQEKKEQVENDEDKKDQTENEGLNKVCSDACNTLLTDENKKEQTENDQGKKEQAENEEDKTGQTENDQDRKEQADEEEKPKKKSFNHQFQIGDEAFMNCTSLKEIIIEDQSKNVTTIKYNDNGVPLFVYPPSIYRNDKYIYKQVIHKKAFYNCTSLTYARFFLGNLQRFCSSAFENCFSLKTMEINSQFWRFLLTEAVDATSFIGTPSDFQVQQFNKNKLVQLQFDVTRHPVHVRGQRHFPQYLSSLDKTMPNFVDFPVKLLAVSNTIEQPQKQVISQPKPKQPQQQPQPQTQKENKLSQSLDKTFFNSLEPIREYLINNNIHLILQRTKNEKVTDFCLYGTKYKDNSINWDNFEANSLLKSQPMSNISQLTQYLHSYTFPSFYELTQIVFDDDLQITSIPKLCFAYTALKEITIPSSVEKIGKYAFLSCSNLEKVSFSENSKLMIIKDSAFSKCPKLESIQLPDEVEIIQDNCFSYTGLKSIVIPSHIDTISPRTFYCCNQLKKVVLSDNIYEIGEFAFARNNMLKRIDLPNSVEQIKSCAFMDCYNLKKVNTTEKTRLIIIEEGSFENTQIEELRINSDATELFSPRNVPKLNKIIFSKGPPTYFIQMKDGSIYERTIKLDYLYDSELDGTEVIKAIRNDFDKSNYYYSAFYHDRKSLKNNDYVKEYTQAAKEMLFQRNRSRFSPEEWDDHPILKLIFVPKGLKMIQIHQDCFSIGDSVLDGMKYLSIIEYKKGITNSVMNFPNYNHLYTGIQNKITEIKINGEFCNLEPKVFSYFKSLEHFEVSKQTDLPFIPKEAFIGCSNLREVYLPSSCYSIEEGAFKDCVKLKVFEIRSEKIISSLSDLSIKNYTHSTKLLEFIRKEAFCNCSLLESIKIPSGIYAICEGAFMNCTNLKEVVFEPSSKDEEDENQDTLEIIEKNAFKNCKSLQLFILPSSCSYIGSAAFMNCSSMKTFEYKGTKLQSIQCRTFFGCKSLTRFKLQNLKYTNNHLSNDKESIEEENNEEEETAALYRTPTRFSTSLFSIGCQAFMNCSSLREVIIEDESKKINTVKFNQNGSPLFVYPDHSKDYFHNYIVVSKRQTIQKKAFCNCKVLTNVKIFLGNLEEIQTNAFKNCIALFTLDINSQYWEYLMTEGTDFSSFIDTYEELQIKLFNKNKFVRTLPVPTEPKPLIPHEPTTTTNDNSNSSILNEEEEIENNDAAVVVEEEDKNEIVHVKNYSGIRMLKDCLSSLDKTKNSIVYGGNYIWRFGIRVFKEYASSLDRTKPLFVIFPELDQVQQTKKSQRKKNPRLNEKYLIPKVPEWINEVVILNPVTGIRCFKKYASSLDKTLPFFSFDCPIKEELKQDHSEMRHYKYYLMTTSEMMALNKSEEMSNNKDEENTEAVVVAAVNDAPQNVVEPQPCVIEEKQIVEPDRQPENKKNRTKKAKVAKKKKFA